MRSLVLIVAVAAAGAVAQDANGQEVVSVPVAQTLTFQASGSHTAYLQDGGCTCQAESRVATVAVPCNGTCAIDRARSNLAVTTAINVALDGGTLTP